MIQLLAWAVIMGSASDSCTRPFQDLVLATFRAAQ
jgi:hypothetical protein